jgi:hypothetical protein
MKEVNQMNASAWKAALCITGLSIVAAITPVAAAQSNSFNGQWKADPASLKYMGPQYKLTTDANGYTVTRGSEVTKIACDGKPQKTEDTMTACTKSGNTYTLDVTRDGKHVRHTTVTLSDDGKTRTSKSEVTPADGSKPYTMTNVSTRVSGTNADGMWKETQFRSSEDSGVLMIEINGNTAKFKETDYPAPLDVKMDGTETKMMDGTVALKLADPHTLKVTYRDSKGKTRRENTFVLSADGKTITETDITPAPSESKMVLTLHKM